MALFYLPIITLWITQNPTSSRKPTNPSITSNDLNYHQTNCFHACYSPQTEFPFTAASQSLLKELEVLLRLFNFTGSSFVELCTASMKLGFLSARLCPFIILRDLPSYNVLSIAAYKFILLSVTIYTIHILDAVLLNESAEIPLKKTFKKS